MSRPYDKNNPRDSAWKASIYQAASEETASILQGLGGSARFGEICRSFSLRHPELCDDDVYEPSTTSWPTWKHAISDALQALKKRDEILHDGKEWRIEARNSTRPSVDRALRKPNLDIQRGERVIEERFPEEPPQELIGGTQLQSDGKELSDRLLERVLELTPQGFERLIGSLLVRLGFVNVELTGGSHDRGIDGQFELNLVGLKLAFQAKRYQPGNIIRAREIRDFRGAMVANQQAGGLFISTSSFTDEARMEADAPGPVISLVDGKRFVEVMIQNNVGIKDVVVDADIDDQFFREL